MRKRFTIKNRLSLITVLCTAALITFLLGNSEPAMNQQVQLTADNNEAITTSFINEQTISSPAESTNENATRVSIAAPETADTNQSVIDNVSQSGLPETQSTSGYLLNTGLINAIDTVINTMGDLNTAEDFISTSSIINNTAFLNLDNTIADTILESLETSPDQQYLPFAHIKDDKDKKDKQKDKDGTIIIHSTTQLMGLFDDGSIIPSRKGETTQTDAILIANDILYRSDDNQLQVTLPKDLVIQKYDGEPFNPQGLELQKNTGEESMAIVQRYDPAMNTYTPIDTIPIVNEDQFEFHFGISGEHLIFSKPLEIIIYTDRTDGTLVDITANHANQGRTKEGLSTDPNTQCNNGIASIPGSISKATNNTITFYICSASVFSVTYIGGANNNNFCDGNNKTKTVQIITGTNFPTGYLITDVDLSVRRRPIDSRDPTRFGTGDCNPGEKYFRLIHPDGTVKVLIDSGQLTAPASNCPEVTTIYDMSGANVITGNYTSGTYKPVESFTGLYGKSPFGDRGLLFGDTTVARGVILYEYTLTITATTGDVNSGAICIYGPDSVTTGFTVQDATGVIEQNFGYFLVDLTVFNAPAYYTTLNISPLRHPNGVDKIATGNMEWKVVTGLVTFTGGISTSYLATGRTGYTTVQGVRTFIKSDTISPKYGRFGAELMLRATLGPYLSVGQYTGTITYTLYEN